MGDKEESEFSYMFDEVATESNKYLLFIYFT